MYGSNDSKEREQLWSGLRMLSSNVGSSWVVLGDFNSPLMVDDRIGRPISPMEIVDFSGCVAFCGLQDI